MVLSGLLLIILRGRGSARVSDQRPQDYTGFDRVGATVRRASPPGRGEEDDREVRIGKRSPHEAMMSLHEAGYGP